MSITFTETLTPDIQNTSSIYETPITQDDLFPFFGVVIVLAAIILAVLVIAICVVFKVAQRKSNQSEELQTEWNEEESFTLE